MISKQNRTDTPIMIQRKGRNNKRNNIGTEGREFNEKEYKTKRDSYNRANNYRDI